MPEIPENKPPHGNSKKSEKEHHIYKIVETEYEQTIKFGISGEELSKNGTSPRANKQVNKMNRFFGKIKYIAVIIKTKIQGRAKALEAEKQLVKQFKTENGGLMPLEQKRPNPEM